MDVTRAQVTCDHSYAEDFWCGICHRLALAPRIHDGGYGQVFCRRVFCSSCIDCTSFNPEARTRIGPRGEKIYACPTEGCFQNFVPPFFRFMSKMEEGLYKALSIKCLNCNNSFNVFQYATHRIRCSAALPAVSASDFADFTPEDLKDIL